MPRCVEWDGACNNAVGAATTGSVSVPRLGEVVTAFHGSGTDGSGKARQASFNSGFIPVTNGPDRNDIVDQLDVLAGTPQIVVVAGATASSSQLKPRFGPAS